MNNTKKGMFCILCAAFFFASMNVCVKLAGNLPSIQKSFFRNLIAALFALIILLKNKEEYLTKERSSNVAVTLCFWNNRNFM